MRYHARMRCHRLRNTLLVIFALLLLVFLGTGAVGLVANPVWAGEKTETLPVACDALWKTLINVQRLPERRPEIESVEIIETDKEGKPMWKEFTDTGGWLEFAMTKREDSHHLEVEMSGSTIGMTGTWTYDLEPAGGSCTLTIAETSRTDAVWIRAMMTIMGRDMTLKEEFRSLTPKEKSAA